MAVADLVEILVAALVNGRMPRQTVWVLGPETLLLSEAVRRVARVLGRKVWIVPAPVGVHFVLARVFELVMRIPLIATAQVRMLAEGFLETAPPAEPLPADLMPQRHFTGEEIRSGLPDPGPFGLEDVRCYRPHPSRSRLR